MLELHDYQKKAISFGLDKKACYFALDTGLGKTAIILKLNEQLNKPLIVFGPLQVILNSWPTEIKKWSPKTSYSIVYGKKKEELFLQKKDIYLISYSTLSWFYEFLVNHQELQKKNSFNLCLDEGSFVKSAKTKRFKILKRLRVLFYRNYILSATPAAEGIYNLWSQYYLLDGGQRLEKVEYIFKNRYFHSFRTTFNAEVLKIKKGAREKIIKAIAPITFRLKAEDYLELPELIYNKIELKLPTKLQKQYKDHEIYSMNSGDEALKILKRLPFNLVISDIQMPGTDGLVLLDYVKKHSPDVPVIIMTSLDKPEIKSLAKQGSGIYYFEKPFDMGEFKKTIKDALTDVPVQTKNELQNLSLKELIRKNYHNKFSGTVNVRNVHKSGMLYFQDGEIIHAITEDLEGELALLNVLSWSKVNYDMVLTDEHITKTIYYGWKLLVKDELLSV